MDGFDLSRRLALQSSYWDTPGSPQKEGKKMNKEYKYNVGSTAPSNRKALDTVADLCTECGKKLGKNPLYFEVNTNWEIIVPGSDQQNSQGCFAIGSTCANKFAPNLLITIGTN